MNIARTLHRIADLILAVLTGIDLPCEVRVVRNFVIEHFGGVVISEYAMFGDNRRIRNGVLVGLSQVDDLCAPWIGNNVDIGVGANLLGRIVVGDNTQAGANVMVLRDVPSNSIALGVPAVVKPRKSPRLRPAQQLPAKCWSKYAALRPDC